eukprot:5978586-Amphidinium_carterae.1
MAEADPPRAGVRSDEVWQSPGTPLHRHCAYTPPEPGCPNAVENINSNMGTAHQAGVNTQWSKSQ